MKKVIALILTLMMATAVIPAAAQSDSDSQSEGIGASSSSSTPSADATADASPMASPMAGGITEGSWHLIDDDNNFMEVDLTAIEDPDEDGVKVVEEFDPEDGTEEADITFKEELDAPEGCRVLQYEAPDMDVFVALCSNDDFGLFAFGTEEEAVTEVAQKFVDGEDNIVPDGYTEDPAYN